MITSINDSTGALRRGVLFATGGGRLFALLCCFWWAWVGARALAQENAQRAINLERFTPALDDQGFLGLQGTRTPGSARWDAGMFLSYSYDPLVGAYEGESRSVKIIQHRLVADELAQLGLGGRTAVALHWPFALAQTGYAVDSDPKLQAAAVGDPSLLARYRFIGVSANDKSGRQDGPGLAAQLGATLPVGHEHAFLGEGAVRSELQLLGDFQLLGLGVGGGLGWLHRFSPRDFFVYRFRDELSFGAAVKVPIPWYPRLTAVLETRGATDAGAPFAHEAATPVELDLGARMSFGDVTLNGAAGIGLGGGIGAPQFRAILGAWWTPTSRDADHDGIPDGKDQCSMMAEDFDGFQDQDGCPDPDNDNDMVPDMDDLCPDIAPNEGEDMNEDGCPDK